MTCPRDDSWIKIPHSISGSDILCQGLVHLSVLPHSSACTSLILLQSRCLSSIYLNFIGTLFSSLQRVYGTPNPQVSSLCVRTWCSVVLLQYRYSLQCYMKTLTHSATGPNSLVLRVPESVAWQLTSYGKILQDWRTGCMAVQQCAGS